MEPCIPQLFVQQLLKSQDDVPGTVPAMGKQVWKLRVLTVGGWICSEGEFPGGPWVSRHRPPAPPLPSIASHFIKK